MTNAIKNEADRIHARGLDADASLAEFRARKHRAAGRELQADIQDEIALDKRRELALFLATVSK